MDLRRKSYTHSTRRGTPPITSSREDQGTRPPRPCGEDPLDDAIQSPIITSFLYPKTGFDFKAFYTALKSKGFVIYPGKISKADTFRIGNIGDVHPEDFARLVEVIRETEY